ncbi:MAG: PIN domain-containing protein [Candidatus Competibacter sp.]|nr:PIN domain-containing protein [Candidatus Competibacter sp.]
MKILDTDVCIEILRGNVRVIECRRRTPDEVATTWITACELAYGAAKSRAPGSNQTLVMAFLATLPILELDWVAAERFGRLKTDLERAGNLLADADLLIAVITLARGARLVTGNRRHYERIPELRIEDWIRGPDPCQSV